MPLTQNLYVSARLGCDGVYNFCVIVHTKGKTATALRLRPEHARDQLAELAHPQFAQWEQESVALAHAHAYRNGTLPGSPDADNGAVLPADYAQTVKPMGERRMILAGYRLAEVGPDIAKLSFGATATVPHGIEPPSIVPEVLKPLWCEFRVPDRLLNVAMPQIMLDSARIQVFVRQVKAARMPQHMGMDRKG